MRGVRIAGWTVRCAVRPAVLSSDRSATEQRNRLRPQLREQRLRIFQVGGVEAFGEPAVDSASIVRASSRRPCSRATVQGSSLRATPRLSRHVLRERDSVAEVGLGQFCLPLFEPQFAAQPERLGPV